METDIISDFVTAAYSDRRLNVWHLALCGSLAELMRQGRQTGPIQITRKKLMLLSRIGSAPTYHKYISHLQSLGYIRYIPSFHPKKGTLVQIMPQSA
jgi:hypothetical protein